MMKFLPRSLPAWVLIIVVLAVLSFQIVTLLIASWSAADSVRTADMFRLAERISGVARALYGQTPEKQLELVSGLQTAFVAVSLEKSPIVENIIADDDEMAELEDMLGAKLSMNGVNDLRIAEYDTNNPTKAPGLVLHGDSNGDGVEADLVREAESFGTSGYFAASMKLSDSGWVNFIVKKSPESLPLTFGSLPIYGLLAAITLLVSVWAVYQLVRPYRRLERAVRTLGEDINAPEIAERGSWEVRAVIRALNAMQRRIRDQMAERQHLAAALAHDLRTPLTRMKIRVELSKSPAIRPVQQDIREIERIVNSVLEYSRAESGTAPKDKIDLTSLVQDVCDNFPDAPVVFHPPGRARKLVVRANATFLMRAVTNLVENAVRHGGSAEVSVTSGDGFVSILVKDKGKGIPPEEMEKVLKPFYRLEGSRNRETGGTGLGLAITDTVARSHGGRLDLSNRPEGGLLAALVLPLVADSENK